MVCSSSGNDVEQVVPSTVALTVTGTFMSAAPVSASKVPSIAALAEIVTTTFCPETWVVFWGNVKSEAFAEKASVPVSTSPRSVAGASAGSASGSISFRPCGPAPPPRLMIDSSKENATGSADAAAGAAKNASTSEQTPTSFNSKRFIVSLSLTPSGFWQLDATVAAQLLPNHLQ